MRCFEECLLYDYNLMQSDNHCNTQRLERVDFVRHTPLANHNYSSPMLSLLTTVRCFAYSTTTGVFLRISRGFCFFSAARWRDGRAPGRRCGRRNEGVPVVAVLAGERRSGEYSQRNERNAIHGKNKQGYRRGCKDWVAHGKCDQLEILSLEIEGIV